MKNKYEPSKIEDKYYDICEKRGYFEIDGNKTIQQKDNQGKDKTFAIMMPPPNITGSLHIGHALTFTIQDVITRYKRMDGYKTLWQPGIDHAGIATQNVVEKQLLQEGTSKEKLGKEEFLNRVWEWKKYSGDTIFHQMRKLGVTPAWNRSRFTMDDGLKHSVKKSFVELYNKKLITQDKYMVNWCVKDGALSDIEVEYKEIQGKLYHIIYKFVNKKGHIQVATTRPETYFGDSAIMVNPKDDRYKDIIGQEVYLPLTNRKIKIITDEHVDMNFGTGIVKVTPSHDKNDYEVGLRHNLDFITIFDDKGILNEYAQDFQGLDRLKARPLIVSKLQDEGYIVKIQDHIHQVGHSYRSKNMVEPYISKQWFLNKEFAKSSIEKTYEGLVKFHPNSWINSYKAWMSELRNWCISRQLWWGHQIPVFNCNSCNHQWACIEDEPKFCPKCNTKDYTQDPDVLDTWFSSALWPFSTLGWENNEYMNNTYNSSDLKEFYPNSLLITGFDIMFFWVARMMMMGEYFLKQLPFKDIYMHALVRDEHGAKMSKSKGNVIDPLDMVEEFSADIVRFSLCYLCVQGRDIKLGVKHLELYRNFTNKFYNAANYLLLNEKSFPNIEDIQIKTPLGEYINRQFDTTVNLVRNALDEYKFNEAASYLYDFVWNKFCDWGIEYSKVSPKSIIELGAIFKQTLKLTSPFMPFISEYLYHKLSNTSLENSESIMICNYPKYENKESEYEDSFTIIEEMIKVLRRAKTVINKGNSKIEIGYIKLDDSLKNSFDIALAIPFIQKLSKIEKIEFINEKLDNVITDVGTLFQIYIPNDSIDMSSTILRLEKQKQKNQKTIDKLNSMLNNENFVKNAPNEVINSNKNSLNEAINQLNKVNSELQSLTNTK
jgi:valyl-tRNA synthetase